VRLRRIRSRYRDRASRSVTVKTAPTSHASPPGDEPRLPLPRSMCFGVFRDQIARAFGYLYRCACASQQAFWAKIDGFDSQPAPKRALGAPRSNEPWPRWVQGLTPYRSARLRSAHASANQTASGWSPSTWRVRRSAYAYPACRASSQSKSSFNVHPRRRCRAASGSTSESYGYKGLSRAAAA